MPSPSRRHGRNGGVDLSEFVQMKEGFWRKNRRRDNVNQLPTSLASNQSWPCGYSRKITGRDVVALPEVGAFLG